VFQRFSPQLVGIVAVSLTVAFLYSADGVARVSRGPVVWSAGMETGDLSEWMRGTGTRADHDSGRCSRPPNGVSSRHAHRGKYSMKLTINTESGTAGCRQNRDVEARTGGTFVYSAWYYLPRREVPIHDMWNVFQFKSDSPTVVSIGTDPFWTINIVRSRRGPLRLVLKWKGGLTDHTQGVPGPFAGSPIQARMYRQHRTVVPIRRWFKISAHLKQSGAFSGRLVVRQNGVRLWNLRQIRTKYPDGRQSWSVANYSNGIRKDPATIYIDDAKVARP
jgi:hypothetical protein